MSKDPLLSQWACACESASECTCQGICVGDIPQYLKPRRWESYEAANLVYAHEFDEEHMFMSRWCIKRHEDSVGAFVCFLIRSLLALVIFFILSLLTWTWFILDEEAFLNLISIEARAMLTVVIFIVVCELRM